MTETMEAMVHRDQPDHKDPVVRTGLMVSPAGISTEMERETSPPRTSTATWSWMLTIARDFKDRQDSRVLRVTRVHKDRKGSKDRKGRPALRDRREILARRDRRGFKDRRDPKARPDQVRLWLGHRRGHRLPSLRPAPTS
jgi:hypothetical protein